MKEINIIAEIGSNHAGDMSLAKEMIHAAHESGANYAKFQSWQEKNIGPGPWDSDEKFFHFKNKREFYNSAELTDQDHYDLKQECDKIGIKFLTTCFDRNRVDFLSELGLDTMKVASFDSTNEHMIRELSFKFDRLVVSTGMTTNEEIKNLCKWLPYYCKNHAILHCVSIYPTPLEKISIEKMFWLREHLNPVGYKEDGGPGEWGVSDHSLGVSVPKIAITYGATWIEKHFTTDKTLPGPDNHMSIDPSELKQVRQFSDDFLQVSSCRTDDVLEEEMQLRQVIGKRFSESSE